MEMSGKKLISCSELLGMARARDINLAWGGNETIQMRI